jgi:hypothetical protein
MWERSPSWTRWRSWRKSNIQTSCVWWMSLKHQGVFILSWNCKSPLSPLEACSHTVSIICTPYLSTTRANVCPLWQQPYRRGVVWPNCECLSQRIHWKGCKSVDCKDHQGSVLPSRERNCPSRSEGLIIFPQQDFVFASGGVWRQECCWPRMLFHWLCSLKTCCMKMRRRSLGLNWRTLVLQRLHQKTWWWRPHVVLHHMLVSVQKEML